MQLSYSANQGVCGVVMLQQIPIILATAAFWMRHHHLQRRWIGYAMKSIRTYPEAEEFMDEFGIYLGFLTLLTIGLGFPMVILIECWLGWLWWPYLLGLGILVVLISLFVENIWWCAWLGVLGATFAWGATELKKQARRAVLGWFPYRDQKIDPPLKEVIRKWKAPSI